MFRSAFKKGICFLVISVLLELLVFNYRAICSWSATNQQLQLLQTQEGVYATAMRGAPHYLYVDIDSKTEEEISIPVTFTIAIQDEGSDDVYELEPVTLYPGIEKSKYLRVHSYGQIRTLSLVIAANQDGNTEISEVIYDARVPLFVSKIRILLLFVLFCLCACVRPGSPLYEKEWTGWQKKLSVCGLILCNIVFFFVLVSSNPAFLHPVWSYHQQYHQLAVALSEGHVSIAAGSEQTVEALQTMRNPYDSQRRMTTVPGADNVWDICYYQGRFYVYFGIVPVLVFYLPYYLLFHSAFPTWVGVWVAGSWVVGGVYYLLAQIRQKWFPQIPYLWYLLLAVGMSNGMQLCCAMLHADFYYLPIVMALAFSLWGLGFFLSASQQKKGQIRKLFAGAFCLALTAGCRPQFLVASFLGLFFLHPILVSEKKTVRKLTAIALPYVITAAGLMYYNFIRFGSVFDFGANYNLTTNDMTRRGFVLDRLPDGLFMYLFQPPSWKLQFPFAEVTPFYSDYLGTTIRDWTFGGALWTHGMLLSLIGVVVLAQRLKEKRLLGFVRCSIGLALVVVAADTQMAGILNRYYTDFLWLLLLPAIILLFQIWESAKGTRWLRYLVVLVLVAMAGQIFYELGISLRGSGILNDNAYRYYWIKALFQ